MIVFLFFRCPLQVLIQVLATVIEGGTVGDTRPIPFGKSVKRPPSGFVTVKEASDAPVAVQQFRRLLHVGDRVQNKAVSVTLFAFDKGEEISTHDSTGDAMVQVLEGKGKFTVGGKEHFCCAGDVLIMPAKVPHAVYAEESFKMLLTVVFPIEQE